MKTNLLGAAALVSALTLSACGKPVDATNDGAAQAGTNTATADAGPFADSEMQMSDAMSKAVGTSASDSWVRKMIEHHRGAVAMSNVALRLARDPGVRQMAQMTVDSQTREIAQLEKLVTAGDVDAASARLYQPGEMQMHQAMMAARGATIDETWMRKMIEHHRGAITMSDVVLAQAPPPAVRAMAQRTKSDQAKEIIHLEAMLNGESPMAAAAAAEPKAAPAEPASVRPRAATAPAPAESPKAAPPEASSKPAPAPEPKPPAPAPVPTCSPEHRAMGHC